MHREQVIGSWRQLKGRAKVQWEKLTDDEFELLEGRRDRFAGKGQRKARYENIPTRRKMKEWYGEV